MQIESKYIKFTSESLIVDDLEKILFFTQWVEINNNNWKWIITSLHNALYRTSIISCRNPNWENIKSKKWWLISIGTALKQCQDKSIMEKFVMSKYLILSETQKKSIFDLTQTFRNNFEHFHPWIWAIEIHYFPMIILNIFEIIEFLIFKSWNCIGFTPEQKTNISKYILGTSKILKELKIYKEYIFTKNEK